MSPQLLLLAEYRYRILEYIRNSDVVERVVAELHDSPLFHGRAGFVRMVRNKVFYSVEMDENFGAFICRGCNANQAKRRLVRLMRGEKTISSILVAHAERLVKEVLPAVQAFKLSGQREVMRN